jgi:hypothetical protein
MGKFAVSYADQAERAATPRANRIIQRVAAALATYPRANPN